MAEGNSSSEHNFSNHLFREIYKNAWLNKVNPSNSEKSGPNQTVFWISQKPERFWFVFCIHDDTEAYLEAYIDAKTSVMHRPTWVICLNDTLHVSSTICSEFKEYEFVITLRTAVVRLLAPTREAMTDWVDTLRTKLTEMKILAPCKNMYTALPQTKVALLPTRDPTSPLPPPPPVSSIPLGTECVVPTSTLGATSTSSDTDRMESTSSSTNSDDQNESAALGESLNNCDNRANTPSLLNNRHNLCRNLSMPSSTAPYVTVIQVSDNDEVTPSAASRTPRSAQLSSSGSSQVFDFDIAHTTSNSCETLSSNEQPSSSLVHCVATETNIMNETSPCQECNDDPSNELDSCSHYDCVFVPNIVESTRQIDNRLQPPPLNGISQFDVMATASTTSLNNPPLPHRRRKESANTNQPPPPPLPLSIMNRVPTGITPSDNSQTIPVDRPVPPTQAAINHLAREITQMTLREQQVMRLQKEIKHPTGVRIHLTRKDCNNAIAIVDVFGGVWVAGWKQKENPMLYNLLHIGDQIISIEGQPVQTAAEAHKHLRRASNFKYFVSVVIKRVPFGKIFVIQREVDGQPLGIVQEQNTAVIKQVLANSLAARHGLSQRATTCDQLSFTNWVLTEINGRPLNLFYKNNEVRDRLNAIGREISILVQPFDLIKQIKKQFKSVRNYKDYIVQ